MTLDVIRGIRFAIGSLIVFLLIVLLFALRVTHKQERINRKELMEKLLRASADQLKGNEKRYEWNRLRLSQLGANYMAGREVLPEEYFMVKLASAVLMLSFGFLGAGVLGAVFIGALGFFMPDLLLKAKNDKDNDRILYDIKGIFDTIKVKTQGGMFLTSAIAECYRNVRNKRLKQALYEMAGQIIAKQDIAETIDDFNVKFKNKYIDTLCIILKQSLDSGKTVEIMESVQDQLADMQAAVNLRLKNRLDAKVQFIQLLLYAAIVALCVFGSFFALRSDLALFD